MGSQQQTAVVKAISDAEDLLENMRATGIDLKQSTVDNLDSAINDVDYDLDVTQQDVVDGIAEAIIAAPDALHHVSTIVLVDESAAYITEEDYICWPMDGLYEGVLRQKKLS